MKDFQKRIIKEKTELDAKLDRLIEFTKSNNFIDVPIPKRRRLRRQKRIMVLYSDVLDERVGAF